MLKFCMTTMLLIEMAIIIVLMRSNAEMVFNYEREQKNHDTSISLMRDVCDEKISRMLMQKCVEEEMPAGGGMVLSWYSNADPSATLNIEIQELPTEWGIGDVLLDGEGK